MPHASLALPILLILLGTPALLPAATGGVDEQAFRHQWYDQGAEITRYALEQARYGEVREGDAVLVYVTEPFDTEQHVKSDDPEAATAVPAFKLNHTRKFLTGIYPYSVMRSTFQAIDLQTHPHAFKSTFSAQEWCGHVFEQLDRRDDGWRLQLFSYFQSEGDQDRELGEAWLVDEFWTRIRLDPESLPLGPIEVIPPALLRRFAHRDAAVMEAEASWIEDLGDGLRHYHVMIPEWNWSLTLQITSTFPWHLQGWREEHGRQTTTATQTHRIHSPYWRLNGVDDTGKRAELGLPTGP